MALRDYIGEATAYEKKIRLERKDPTSWLKSVSAFANTEGGKLLFGVADEGSLVGLADAEGDAEAISEAVKSQMGFKKILDAYAFESKKRGKTVVPQLKSTRTDFFLILPNLNYGKTINGIESSSEDTESGTVIKDTIDAVTEPTTKTVTKTTTKTITKPLSKEAREILKILAGNHSISAEQLGKVLGLSVSGVRYHIRALTKESLIRRVGSSKTGYWEVLE